MKQNSKNKLGKSVTMQSEFQFYMVYTIGLFICLKLHNYSLFLIIFFNKIVFL